jgi:O-antigen/teichoic acid export membrane protein
MTRYLGPENYGVLAWTMSFIAVFNIISDFGVSYAHIKRVSEGQDVNACVSTFAFLKLGLTALMVTICLASVFIYNVGSMNQFSGDAFTILLCLLGYQVLGDLVTIAKTTFDARLITSKSQMISIVDPLVRVPSIIIILVAGLGGVIQVALAYLATGIAVSIIAIILFSKEHVKWQKPTLLRSYASFALPVGLAVVAGVLVSNIDKLSLGYFWSKADVGFYTSGLSLLQMFGIIGTAVSFIAFPVFSMMQKNGKREDIKHRVKQAERYISMISMPVVIILVMFPDITARMLFGADFAPAGKTMPFLAISVFCYQLNQVACSFMLASGQPGMLAKLTWMQLILLTALLMLFVPSSLLGVSMLGLAYQGAALANMIAMIVMFVVARYYIWKVANVGIYLRLYLHVLVAFVVAVLLFLLSMFLPINAWYILGIFGILAYLVYFGIMYAIKELTNRDIQLFLDMANFRKMRDYIKGEF